jgi:hypothetical protein
MDSIEDIIYWRIDKVYDRNAWNRTLIDIRNLYETSLAGARESATVATHNLLSDKERDYL